MFARVLPFAVLIAEVVAFHRRILFRPEYVLPWDFRNLHWPFAELQAASLRLGQFPFEYLPFHGLKMS